jgi:hypothetical protein
MSKTGVILVALLAPAGCLLINVIARSGGHRTMGLDLLWVVLVFAVYA